MAGGGSRIYRTHYALMWVKPNAYDCVQGGRRCLVLTIFVRTHYVHDPGFHKCKKKPPVGAL